MSDDKKDMSVLLKTDANSKSSLIMKWEGVGGLRCGWTLVPDVSDQKKSESSALKRR